MPALQVRDFPDDLYEQLKDYAASQHRSVAQQTIVAVEQMLAEARTEHDGAASSRGRACIIHFDTEAERQARIAKRKAIFDEIARMPKMDIPDDFPSAVEILHQAREERDRSLFKAIGLPLNQEEEGARV